MSIYSSAQWQSIQALGHLVDKELQHLDVNLTMGGEPTYVSATDRTSLQWRYQALGDDKYRIGQHLLQQLRQHLGPPGALCHYGVGKLYPGEPFPRWALGCFWREDGSPLWRYPELMVGLTSPNCSWQSAKKFSETLTAVLGLPASMAMAIYDIEVPTPVGYVLPILPVDTPTGVVWASCPWRFRLSDRKSELVLVPGPSPAGMRLPLQALTLTQNLATEAQGTLADPPIQPSTKPRLLPDNTIQIGLCIEVRGGQLYVFMPPLLAIRGYIDLLTAVEKVAHTLQLPIRVEGYRPPINQGVQGFQITPDPGVLEVNIHPARSWDELVHLHTTLDRTALACGLSTVRYERDGRPIDTGGGAHITLGAEQPHKSPLFRRPDLLRSLVTYWQHHPSLSYLFAGQFIGATSQSPRVDEAIPDSLEQLDMAFSLLRHESPLPPSVVDHLLHHLLVDLTGNSHRAAFCIDKLYPTHNPSQQLGLLELRGFAMPPEGQMRLLQMLLVRAFVVWFWQQPYLYSFQPWGCRLHDRYLLPYFIQQDFEQVIQDLNQVGYGFQAEWFQPFLEFRCPIYGHIHLDGVEMELRHALEPWPVLADETGASGASRPVDDSTERLQVILRPSFDLGRSRAKDLILLCNGRRVPLHQTDPSGELVTGIRYRARSYLWEQIAPTLAHLVHSQQQQLSDFFAPVGALRFELFDGISRTPLGGCWYQVPDLTKHTDPVWPTSKTEAEKRWRDRMRSIAAVDCTPLPAEIPEPSLALVTFDLRDPRQK
jgi:uncharacterized protein (DUF2126 family)